MSKTSRTLPVSWLKRAFKSPTPFKSVRFGAANTDVPLISSRACLKPSPKRTNSASVAISGPVRIVIGSESPPISLVRPGH
jgi:hypothetical protein